MMIKGINALVDAKRASSFNNAIKLVNENVQITHDRRITLENRRAMMAKAIIPVLKDFKQKINNTNDRLIRQYCPPICLCWLLGRKEKKFLSAVTVCLYSVSHVVHVPSEHAQY